MLLETILAYLINLASNERSSAIGAAREQKLKELLEQEDSLKRALASFRSISEEVRHACKEVAQDRKKIGVTDDEVPIWQLLSSESFQSDISEWLMAGGIEEGQAAKTRIVEAMEEALPNKIGKTEQVEFLKRAYFDALEKAVFTSPILAQWRHRLSLDYLRDQVVVLRRHAEENAGIFSQEKQRAVLARYCEKALATWDIIDLSNLPEGDIHMATQKLLLRQLYMPLRIEVEPKSDGEGDDDVLARMEKAREARRHREAGHFVPDDDLFSPNTRKTRVAVGERLEAAQRLVVLGDPGGGKTTMLRWMATAYLLRYTGDTAFALVPDTATLPDRSLVPVLIRCRDLGEADLCRCFVDFLTQHLNKTELLPEEAGIMRAVILDKIAKGEALLLVDGLDEIANPRVRMTFCQELERTATRYPDAPIIVTSRIVGYRDMPYRMGSGFEHGQIGELSREDKDLFAHRWVEITEQSQSDEEKTKRTNELLEALHSNDRIERLTGNPMLLTTLALVKRKVGKLPNRRTKLYSEAVSVLLNWNPRLYQTIEEDEAIPQLEYLAYEMCRRGVQRLAEDEVLDLLEKLRAEYPNIRAIKRRDAYEFLKHLEQRSSILIKSGGIWQQSAQKEKSVWEFRHLTFQEYLAARALLDGRFPNRNKAESLADQVAPLAGTIKKSGGPSFADLGDDLDVPESWREALRLLVADCKDDDVDDVLQAILSPMSGEDATVTLRPRAVLATLCLADEPNVSEASAQLLLNAFASAVGDRDGTGHKETALDRAALDVGKSIWRPALKCALMSEYSRRPPGERWNVGGLWGMVEGECRKASISRAAKQTFFEEVVGRLRSDDRFKMISAALTVMDAAYDGDVVIVEDLVPALLDMLMGQDLVSCHASAWALGWLCLGKKGAGNNWKPQDGELSILVRALERANLDEGDTVRWLVNILAACGDNRTVQPLLGKLNVADNKARQAVVDALGKLKSREALPQLLPMLDEDDFDIKQAVIKTLAEIDDKEAVCPLIARLDDPDPRIRGEVVDALVSLGDKRAIEPLLSRLSEQDEPFRATVALALHKLGEEKGTTVMRQFLTSEDLKQRKEIIRAYARHQDNVIRSLLSRDLDGASPWLDPRRVVGEVLVTRASEQLSLSRDEIRTHYESLAEDLGLKLAWNKVKSS